MSRRYSPLSEIRLSPLAFLLAAGIAATAAACTSKKQEASEALDKAIKKCRAADGPIHEAELMRGSDKQPVLVKGCEKDQGDVEMVDEFTAQVQTGPYTWEAGLDQSIGIWTLKSVSFPALDTARDHLEGDPGKNQLDRAIGKLREAQKAFPESGWIRLKLLDALLERRIADRKTDKSGLDVGGKVEKQLEATLEWANENERRSVAAEARLKMIEYFEGFAQQAKDAKSALGSQDDWYKKSIEVAKEEGNEKEAEKYRKELEKMKKKRPRKRKLYTTLVEKAQSNLCGHLAQLKPEGIQDEKLKKRVQSKKSGINCRELLKGQNE